jgi:predicted TPR repeat methyltransferase
MSDNDSLVDVWNSQYVNSNDTALKDKNYFNLEVNAILEQILKYVENTQITSLRILELGSGTGLLSSLIKSALSQKTNCLCFYTGIDFSDVAVKKSNDRNLNNCKFIQNDFINFFENNDEKFDIIISQRSIMALMENKLHIQLLQLCKKSLSIKGVGIFSEVTTQSFKKIQELRKKLSISPLEKVWHSCYLDENIFQNIFSSCKIFDFSSTYWLITRAVYPYFEEPKHNSTIHEFAANLSQTGNYGLTKLFVVQS